MNYSHPYRKVESSPPTYSRSSQSTPSKKQSPLPRYSSSSPPSSPSSSLSSYQSSSREEARIKLEPLLFSPTQPLWSVTKDLFRSKKGKGEKKMDADLPAPTLTNEEVEVAKDIYAEWMSRF